MSTEIKKFFCGTGDICPHKEHFVNNRCFASYAVRQTCLYIIRVDNKTRIKGSKEEDVLCR